MDVKCPNCKSTFNIDISKIPVIPEGGITTTCPKCKGKIPINLGHGLSKTQQIEQIIPCPECGRINISTNICTGCGKVFSKEEIEKLEIPIS